MSVVRTATAWLAPASDARRGRLYVALGAIAWSSAGLLQREIGAPPATQLGGRALFAFLALLAFVTWSERHRGGTLHAFRAIGSPGVAIAVCMAISSGAFMLALSHTSVARLLFITAVAPLVAALLAHAALGERVDGRTWAAMLVALGGVGLMLLSGAGDGDRIGDVLAVLCMVSFSGAIVLTRWRSEVSMAPATCLSQVFVALAALPYVTWGAVGPRDGFLLAIFGFGQIGLGLALLTVGARLIPAAHTALLTLLEIVLGPLWVWLAYRERPGTATLVGGAVVVAAILVQVGGPALRSRRTIEPA